MSFINILLDTPINILPDSQRRDLQSVTLSLCLCLSVSVALRMFAACDSGQSASHEAL